MLITPLEELVDEFRGYFTNFGILNGFQLKIMFFDMNKKKLPEHRNIHLELYPSKYDYNISLKFRKKKILILQLTIKFLHQITYIISA